MNTADGSSKLGFGVSGPLGAVWFAEAKTRALVRNALAGGIRHFDTAPFYGDGEGRIGRALAGAGKVFISTKTGTWRSGGAVLKDFTARKIREDIETSLRNLGVERLDLLYLHGPSIPEMNSALPALEALKREGKVAAFGVCGEGAPLAHAVDAGFDAVMGAFNVLDRRHLEIFRRAKSAGIQTVAIQPLASSAIGPFRVPVTLADFWRVARSARRGGAISPAARNLAGCLAEFPDWSPAGAALAFVCEEPSIDVVLTTTTKTRHLAQSLAASARPLPAPLKAALGTLSLDPDQARP